MADRADGDARRAIGIFRNAVQFAQRDGEDRVTRELIEEAVPATHSEIQQWTTDKLTEHRQILYNQ
jgi:Cdc6-like AAA superfamily ATPase